MASERVKISSWIEAMRLRTLPVGASSVLAGTACAIRAGSAKWGAAAICLVFAILAQIASNFANEYFDFRNGLDRKGRDGFRRGVTEGDITPRSMYIAVFATLALACATGCLLIPYGGIWLIAAGLIIALGALSYSTGPWPLSHHGLGDVAVILFYGIIPVFLTQYVQSGWPEDWIITLTVGTSIGLLAANVLIVNNYRDYDDDLAVGKNTTAVIFGRQNIATCYLAFAIVGVTSIGVILRGEINDVCRIIIDFSLIIPLLIWRAMLRRKGSELNPLLGCTAAYLFVVAAIMLVGAILGK